MKATFKGATIVSFTDVIGALLLNGAIRATKYYSPSLVLSATRRTYKAYGKKLRLDHNTEILLKIGKPNYIEREFIKDCIKAKEPFPVKRIQLKLYNPPKKALKRK